MLNTIKGDILIDEKIFIRELLNILHSTNLEGWKARFGVCKLNCVS
jgi:hypothetical protein